MKNLLVTTILLAGLTGVGFAQNTGDSTGRSRPVIDENTKQQAREGATQAGQKLEEEVEESRSYQQRNQLSWFQQGSVFGGGGLGFGATGGQVYIDVNTRLGYFIQPGFAAGIRYDSDRLVGNKYHARQFGLFTRYYPFRTRVSSFVGASLNSGREFSETIPDDEKARYTSVGLELGVMAWVLRRLGAEVTYEGSFYNKIDPTASRGKGGRIKLGVNYYFGSVDGRGRFSQRR